MGTEDSDEEWAMIEQDSTRVRHLTTGEWFGYWMKEVRSELGWSHSELAKAAIDAGSEEVSPRLLERIENGAESPTIEVVMFVAAALDVSPLSMIVGFYAKDQVVVGGEDRATGGIPGGRSEHSADFAQWWVGVPRRHGLWHSAQESEEHFRTRTVRQWAVGIMVRWEEFDVMRRRVDELVELLRKNEVPLPSWAGD